MKVKKENIDEKIDSLAITIAKGFDGVHKEIKELRKEINQNFEDHIKTVRLDYDNLTNRVSVVERKVMR